MGAEKGAGTGSGAVLRMVSRMEGREEFLDAFLPFVDEHSLLVITKQVPAAGARQRFSIELKGGIPVLRGEGTAVDPPPQPDGDRPVKMRLHILSWEGDSEAAHREMLERKRRRAEAGQPPPRPRPPLPPGPLTGMVPQPDDGDSVNRTERIEVTETRTPGAAYQLPANPLSEIDDRHLENFIDCVLHEGEAEPREEPAARSIEPPDLAPWNGNTPVPVPAVVPPTAPIVVQAPPLPPVNVRAGVGTHVLTAVLAATCAALGTYIYVTHRSSGNADDGPAPVARVEPVARPAAAPPRPAGPPPAAVVTDPPPSPAPAPIEATTPVEATPPIEATPTADPPADPPTDPPAAPTVTADPDGCRVIVRSHPEARVQVDGKLVGNPPVDAVIPCDSSVMLAVTHPRYKPYQRKVVGRRGEPLEIDAHLSRPEVLLSVASTPAGATISIDGQIIGRSPARGEVKGFSSVMVTASLDGYKLWSKRVQTKGGGSSVHARLESIPGAP